MALHPDVQPYHAFTGRARLDKAINSLLGIVDGIAIDGVVNDAELAFLDLWLAEHSELRHRHPYSEIVPVVEQAIADRQLDGEEREDIRWLCARMTSSEFYDRTSADLQRLHGLLGGIIADAQITADELRGLSDWLEEHSHLRTCWPYDEIGALITAVLADGRVDEHEHTQLMRYFADFVEIGDARTVTAPPLEHAGTVTGLCAVDPVIEFDDRGFCFTGASSRLSRKEWTGRVADRGGRVHDTLSKKVDYLVIGADGNPCWAYACYGRKVEKAVEMRRAGARIVLVHEIDLHDALA